MRRMHDTNAFMNNWSKAMGEKDHVRSSRPRVRTALLPRVREISQFVRFNARAGAGAASASQGEGEGAGATLNTPV